MDTDERTVELRVNEWSSGPVTMSAFDRAVEEMRLESKKYRSGGPYVYVATRPFCACALAMHPHGHDHKAAGRVLAEWGKAGWMVRTVGKRTANVAICEHSASEYDEPLVYVAEKYCGCCVGVQPPIPGGEAGVAKVLQVWAEQGYYIQSIPLSEVYIEPVCPHEKPKEKQEMLPGLASADVEEYR